MKDLLYPTAAQLDTFLKTFQLYDFGLSLQKKGFVAPTIFLQKGKLISGWNTYATLQDAFNKIKYLIGDGGADIKPAGSVSFKKDGTAQTIGINVDFYVSINKDKVVNLGYAAFKTAYEKFSKPIYFICKFYKPDGTGPYFLIFDKRYMAASATTVSSYEKNKVAALDELHRETALLKAQHNVLASFLNKLAAKQLSPLEQQIFNQGMLRLSAMRSEMSALVANGTMEVYYSKDGTIGALPVVALIAWIVVGAGVVGWTVQKIVADSNKVKRMKISYDHQKWAAEQELIIAEAYKNEKITKEDKDRLTASVKQVSQQAGENATTASQPEKSMFGEIGDIVKWGAIGFGIYAVANAIGNSKSK